MQVGKDVGPFLAGSVPSDLLQDPVPYGSHAWNAVLKYLRETKIQHAPHSESDDEAPDMILNLLKDED